MADTERKTVFQKMWETTKRWTSELGDIIKPVFENIGKSQVADAEYVTQGKTDKVQALKPTTTPTVQTKQPTQELKPIVQYTSYDSMPQHPLGYSYDKDDSWTFAIVDNKSVHNGYADTAYGYRIVSADDEHDGQVVAVNQYGDVRYLEDEPEQSEDWHNRLYQFKAQYNEARSTFDTYYKIQEHAKAGEEYYSIDINDPYQTNSVLDIVASALNDWRNGSVQFSDQAIGNIEARSHYPVNTVRGLKDYLMRSTTGKIFTNVYIENKYGSDWVSQFQGSEEKLKQLLDEDLPEHIKDYMAYQIVTGDDKLSVADALNEVFTNLGEAMDWGANPIKAGVQWLDDNLPVQLWDLNKSKDLKGTNFFDTLGSTYASPYSETGRMQYDYSTGWFVSDLLLEVFSDPSTLLSIGTSAATSSVAGAAKETMEEATGEVLERSAYKNLKTIIKTGAREGLTDDAIVARIANKFPKYADETVMASLKHGLEYSKAMKVVRSLQSVDEVVDSIDRAMAFTSQLTGPLGPVMASAGAVRKILSIPNAARAFKDTVSEIVPPGQEPNIFNINDIVDMHNAKVMGMNIYDDGEVLKYIPYDQRSEMIAHNYIKTSDKLRLALVLQDGKSTDQAINKFNQILSDMSGGKVKNFEDFVNFTDELRTGDQTLNSILTTNLDEIRYALDVTLKQANDLDLTGVYKAYSDLRKMVETVDTIKYKNYFKVNLTRPEFKEFLKDYKDDFIKIVPYKEYAANKDAILKSSWYHSVDNTIAKGSNYTFAGFWLKLQEIKEIAYVRQYGDFKYMSYSDWEAMSNFGYKELPKLNDFLKQYNLSKDTLKLDNWLKAHDLGLMKYMSLKEFIEISGGAVEDRKLFKEAYDSYIKTAKEYNDALIKQYKNEVSSAIEAYKKYVEDVKNYNKAIRENSHKLYKEYNTQDEELLEYYKELNLQNMYAKREALMKELRPDLLNLANKYLGRDKVLLEMIQSKELSDYAIDYIMNKVSYIQYLQSAEQYNSTVFEKVRTLFKDRQDYITAYKDWIHECNEEIYLNKLNPQLDAIREDVVHIIKQIMPGDKEVIKRAEELASKEDLHKLLDYCKAALDYENAKIYNSLRGPYAIPPQMEMQERVSNIIRGFTDKFAERLKDSELERTQNLQVKAKYIDDTRVYKPQVSLRAQKDYIIADEELTKLILSITDPETKLYDLVHTLYNSNNDSYKYMAREVMSAAYTTKGYIELLDDLDNARYIPEGLKNGIIDHWFTDADYMRYPFKGKKPYEITPDTIYKTARYRAQESIRHALREINMRFDDSTVSLFDKNCNTADTALNVKNMKSLFEQYVDFNVANKVPIFYSVNFYGTYGNVTELTFMIGDEVKTFKYDYTPSTHRTQSQRMFQEVQAWLDEQRRLPKNEGKFTQFVGFNNHSTSVLDLDYRLGQQLKYFGTGITLGETIDIAEAIRIRDFDFPVVPQSTIEELAEIYNKRLTAYYGVEFQIDRRISGSFIPKIDERTVNCLPKIRQRYSRSGGELYSVMRELERIRARMITKFKEIGELQTKLLNDIGYIKVDYHKNIMSVVEEANADMPYEILNVRRLLDGSLLKSYFNLTDDNMYNYELLHEFAKDAQDNILNVRDASLWHSIAGNGTPESMYQFLRTNTAFGKENAYIFNNLQDFSSLPPLKQYGVIRAAYINTNYKERGLFEKAFGKSSLVIRYPDTFMGLRNGNVSLANIERELRGSAVEPMSRLNRPETISLELAKAEQNLRTTFDMLDAHEEALRINNRYDSVADLKLKHQRYIATRYRKFVEFVQLRVNEINSRLLTKRAEAETLIDVRKIDVMHGDGYSTMHYAFMDAAMSRDAARFKFISSQNQPTFEKHLLKECNGRMVIDTRYNVFDSNDVDNLMRLVAQTPNAKYRVLDNRFLTIWYDCSKLTQADYNRLSQELSDFTLPRLIIDYPEVMYAPDRIQLQKLILDKMDELFKTDGPASLTYGMFHMVDNKAIEYIDERFFPGLEKELMPQRTVVQLGGIDQPNCMYHGDISELSKSSELFLSNDMFTNICNTFGKLVQASDNSGDLLRFAFSKENSFKNFVERVNTYDGIAGRKAIRDYLEAHGYGVYTLGFRNNKYRISKLDISTSKGFNAAYNGKNVAVMRVDTMYQVNKYANLENLMLNGVKDQCKLMEIWNTKIRPIYIGSYLYQKRATVVRNMIDSSFKALNYEGPAHIEYMIEAYKAQQMYDTFEKKIIDTYRKVDDETILKYFTTYDTVEHMHMFNNIRNFYKDPRSGTMMERMLEMMTNDTHRALKSVLDMDLTKEQYTQIVEIFEGVRTEFGEEAPIEVALAEVFARLSKLYSSTDAYNICKAYKNYLATTATKGTWSVTKFPGVGKIFEMNAKGFSQVEQINRLAIYLKHLDEGHTPGRASQAISLTQFDYSKSDLLKAAENVAPFTTFKFYNYEYWLLNAWKFKYFSPFAGTLATFEAEQFSDAVERGEDYWSEDALLYRAMLNIYLDSMDEEDRDKVYTYDPYYDYNGLDMFDAIPYGWVKVGKRIFFKAGLSMVDAFSTLGIVTGDVDFTWDNATNEEDRSILHSIGTSLLGYTHDMLFQPIKAVSQWLSEIALGTKTYDDFADFFNKNQYDFMSLIPVIGSLYYSIYGTLRNYENGGDPLTYLIPSLFGMVDESTYSDKLEKSTFYEYLSKPVGYDWYNQSEEYRATHKFIVGVSYVPTWLGKDPASWIDNHGRLMQLGFTQEQIQDMYEVSGNWWFTEEGDGYKLHNYQLMIGNENVWNEVYNSLVNKYGWTSERAITLMNEAAIPMWDNRYNYGDATQVAGSSLSRIKYNYTSGGGVRVYNSKAMYRLAHNYNRTPKGSGFLSARLGGSSVGKRAGYRTPYVKRGGNPYYRNNTHTTYARWRRRYRDIYRDNYAKYGASRMAMEQNLRSYSNRSVTEMRRTNQNIRYSRIKQRRNRISF